MKRSTDSVYRRATRPGVRRRSRRRATSAEREAGAAVVEFTLVVGLLVFVFAGVLELGVLLHIRDVVTADAAEGARFEANADAPTGSGSTHAQALLASTLGSLGGTLACTSQRPAGEIAVTCGGRVDLPFLPVAVHISQTAHALAEQP